MTGRFVTTMTVPLNSRLLQVSCSSWKNVIDLDVNASKMATTSTNKDSTTSKRTSKALADNKRIHTEAELGDKENLRALTFLFSVFKTLNIY